jgi:uncharacterized protein (TIGR02301 family)
MIRGLCLALFLGLSAGPAMAQTPPEPPPAPPVIDVPKPYEAELTKLVETLGSVSYLASVCADQGLAAPAIWRERAAALIDSEAPEGPRRARLLGLYQRGAGGVALVHRQCTDATRVLVARLLADAAELTRSIGARYGG